MGQKYEDDKFDGNYADEEDEIVIMIIGDIEKRDKYNVEDEKCDKDNDNFDENCAKNNDEKQFDNDTHPPPRIPEQAPPIPVPAKLQLLEILFW